MSAIFPGFLASPVFEDKEKTLQADLLNRYSLAALAVTVVVLALNLTRLTVAGDRVHVLGMVAIVAATLMAQVLLRAHQVRWGATVMVVALLCITSIQMVEFRHLDHTLFSYANIIILTGLVLGRRFMWFALLTSVASSIIMVVLGVAPNDMEVPRDWTLAELMFTFVTSMAIMTWVFDHALRRLRESNRELHASEARWQFALEGAGDGVWDWNAETNEVFFSRQWKAMLGFEEHEVGNALEEWNSRVHPDDKQRCLEDLERHFRGESPSYTNEHRVRCKDGSYKWILDRGKVVDRAPDGKPRRIIGTHTDISAKKEAEQHLRQTQEMLAQVLDSVPQSVFWKDRNSTFMGCNRAFAQAVGYEDPSGVVGKTDYDIIADREEAESYRRVDQEVMEQRRPRQHILRESELPNRSKAWIDTTKIPLIDHDGQVYGVLGVYDDITERKMAEEALRESETRFRSIVESSPLGMHMYELKSDGNLVFIGANRAADRILGVDNSKFIGKTIEDAFPGLIETEVPQRYREVASGGVTWQTTQIDYDRDQIKGAFEVIAFQIFKDKMVAMFMDVTERKKVEDALHHERNLLRTLIDNLPEGVCIYIKDAQSRYLINNRAHLRTLGASEQHEVLGKTALDYYPKEMALAFLADEKPVLEAGTPLVDLEELALDMSSGETRWHLTTKVPLRDANQKIVGLVGMSSDITELKRATEALRMSEEKHRSLFENMAQGVVYQNAEGEIVDLNPAAQHILGLPADALKGRFSEDSRWRAIREDGTDFPGDEHPSMQALRSGAEVRNVMMGIFNPELDEHRWLRIHAVPQFKAGMRKPFQVFSTFDDITERKRAEDALFAEKQQLAVTLKSIGDGVITTDTAGRVLILNKVAEAMTGWSVDEALGKPLNEVFRIFDEATREACENPVDQVLRTKGVIELANHTVLLSRDGREMIVADSGAPILDDEGRIIGVVLVFRDMTEKQRLLEAAQKSQKLDSLGVLAGGIAHDFNNLLGGIFGYIEMARSKNSDATVAGYLDKALMVFGRAKDLTQRLLTFAKGGKPVRKTVPIGPIVTEAVQFALSGSNVTCQFEMGQELSKCDVDESQLSQVIDNIVINAKQAMPEGGSIVLRVNNMVVRTGDYRGLPPGKYVRIDIKDHGEGIPKEILPLIFDPFFTTKPKGNGLGLATSFSIVQKHDGMIEVDSRPGKGATFTIILPASEKEPGGDLPHHEPTHVGKGTVLVMDDEEFIREVLRDSLLIMGYDVLEATNGDNALKELANASLSGTQVVGAILDLTIPGGRGGKETIAEIRKRHPSILVFASSGYSDDPVMAKPAEYGFTDSIKKPFRYRDLAEMLNKHLRLR